MRRTVVVAAALLVLAGCGAHETRREKADKADARVAAMHYRPPSVLSRLDYGGTVERRFHALDRNGDLYVTPDELPAGDPRHVLALDADHDGRVSSDEFSRGLLARFDKEDANRDGTVTSAEHEDAKTPR